MIRIALVEDDARCREELTGYLERYEQENGEKFRVTAFTDGQEIAEHYTGAFDLILMDIEMRVMDGMTAAERIRAQDSEVVIIFITNMPQYVMKGYTVDALDYVLKPVTYFAFSQRISRALERMTRRTRRYITIPIRTGVMKLDVGQITYVEIMNHSLLYHTVRDVYECKGSLTETAAKLEKEHFFRISNCYLVNLEYVESVCASDATVNGEVLSVSRTRKKPLLDALNDYMNEVSK
ncbi:MAG: LytTR family DNA-binding domain-containing protein [bacterium]|nr:LytTR family DNA-binding domain-containing protein [bacterium]